MWGWCVCGAGVCVGCVCVGLCVCVGGGEMHATGCYVIGDNSKISITIDLLQGSVKFAIANLFKSNFRSY